MENLFDLEQSADLGRFLVARSDLPARMLLMKEKPLACAPADDDRGSPGSGPGSQNNNNQESDFLDSETQTKNQNHCQRIPMCLGCFVRMTECPENRCHLCGWPVCQQSCAQLPHHHENECQLFGSTLTPYPPPYTWPILYKSILVLRSVLLKSKQMSKYTEILRFEDHQALRWKKPDCVQNDKMIVENLKYFFQNGPAGSTFDLDLDLENEILRISGIINVNAFTTLKEIQPNNGVAIVQCLFERATLLSHSCCPNSTWSIGPGPDFEMSIWSAVPIPKGQMVTIPYSARENLYGTLQRLVSTEDVAHFTCKCHRCIDPTELGTMVSAIKCSAYNPGQCPGYLLPVDPVDPASPWKCNVESNNNCQFSTSVQNIVRLLCRVEAQLEKIKLNYEKNGNQNSLSNFLAESESLKEKCHKILHPNHYLIQEICLTIVKKQASRVSTLQMNQVSNFIKHCQFLLEIANVTSPGYCRHRAILQFYLSRGLHREARLRLQENLENQTQEKDGDDDGDYSKNSWKHQHLLNAYKRIAEYEREALLFFSMEEGNDNDNDGDSNNPLKTNSNNVYLTKLTEQRALTLIEIEKFQNIIDTSLQN